MGLRKYSYDDVYKKVEKTPFASIFRPLEKIKDMSFFHGRASDNQLTQLFEVELMLGYKLPQDYINMLKLFNGCRIGSLYFLPANGQEEKSLYYENFINDTKGIYEIAHDELIIAIGIEFIITLWVNEEKFIQYNIYEKTKKKKFLTVNELSHVLYYEITSHKKKETNE